MNKKEVFQELVKLGLSTSPTAGNFIDCGQTSSGNNKLQVRGNANEYRVGLAFDSGDKDSNQTQWDDYKRQLHIEISGEKVTAEQPNNNRYLITDKIVVNSGESVASVTKRIVAELAWWKARL